MDLCACFFLCVAEGASVSCRLPENKVHCSQLDDFDPTLTDLHECRKTLTHPVKGGRLPPAGSILRLLIKHIPVTGRTDISVRIGGKLTLVCNQSSDNLVVFFLWENKELLDVDRAVGRTS